MCMYMRMYMCIYAYTRIHACAFGLTRNLFCVKSFRTTVSVQNDQFVGWDNGHVSLLNPFLKSIAGPPVIYFFPMDQTVLEDDSVTFQCFGGGAPFPNVTWTFGGSELTPGEKYAIADGGHSFGALTIFNVTFEDRGTYTCTYSNPHGSPYALADLTVQG